MHRLGGPGAAPALAGPAAAHTGGVVGGLQSGGPHPIRGLDHVAAMVAAGLWGGILGRPAIRLLPVALPLAMAVSAAAAIGGIPLPFAEAGIARSGVALGLAVLLAWRAPLWAALAIVAAFALFHGDARGTELPEAANPAAYALGFVVATGGLRLAGVGVGLLWRRRSGQVVRAAGGARALAGAAFLTGLA